MDLALTASRVLVTGASRGIGAAIARAFLQEGARVTLVARDASRLGATAQALARDFGAASVLTCAGDCANPEDVARVCASIVDAWGGLDIAVANAGSGRSVPAALPDRDRFAETWRANFTSAEETARAVLPLLGESRGCLLFIASIAGLEAIGAPTDYSVAKSAVIALMRQLARKCGPDVRVNCLAPGNVFVPGGTWDRKRAADPESVDRQIATAVPLQRFGTAEEMADAALFLCSARARFITGACLVADGGQTVAAV